MSLKNGLKARKVFLVGGKRTPFGEFGGTLLDVSPVDLAVYASKAWISDLKVDINTIDQFILGNVVPTTSDTLYGGRHLALKSGAPIGTPGITINRLCGSGIQSILDAARLILTGEANSVVAAGSENMSNIPHLTYGGRFGTKYGSLKSVDLLIDSLNDEYAGIPMGMTAENLAEKYGITREECEQFSMLSHQKASKAWVEGHFNDEVVPIKLKRKICKEDEHIRSDINLEKMSKLRCSFKKEGVVTAATASGIVDGAASVLIASEDYCKEHKLNPLAQIVDGVVCGVEPKMMGIGPVPVIQKILNNNEKSLDGIDLYEINEAFSAQAIACIKELKMDLNKLNIWGGSIAIGHPLGASGTRIALSLSRQLQETNKNLGIASACIGGGQGIGLLLKRVEN